MTKQITLEQALELVSFEQDEEGYWRVFDVNVNGYVYGNLRSSVGGKLNGSVIGGLFSDGEQLMTKQITLEQALELVSFEQDEEGYWRVLDVDGGVYGNVYGSVCGYVNGHVRDDVNGNIWGNVRGYVGGNVCGHVIGKINGRRWESVETPKEKLQRLITESGDPELIDAFNQLEDN